VKRTILVMLVVVPALGATAQPAEATNECRGLQVCVRVAGPWVAVPGGLRAPRVRVNYQLSCPQGFAVGGLDAELSDRAIDVDFLGKLGSPVGPGVTTGRAAVFGAAYIGATARAPSFRPHLGCIPASGGGGGPVPFRRPDATFPPGEPAVRRVRNVRLRPGNVRAVAACGAGERLVSGWHAIGFYTSSPPSAQLIRSAVATRTVRSGRVEVRVRGGAALSTVRAVVQVGAVCGGGS
jgi:hypothetical protein